MRRQFVDRQTDREGALDKERGRERERNKILMEEEGERKQIDGQIQRERKRGENKDIEIKIDR